jgi:hypothetical protein
MSNKDMSRKPGILTLYRICVLLLALGVFGLALRARRLKQQVATLEHDIQFAAEREAELTKTEIESILRQQGLNVDDGTVDVDYEQRCNLYFYLDDLPDLSVLQGLPPAVRLVSLNIGGTKVPDLGVLQSEYESDLCLEELSIEDTQISDLTPLVGHPIHWLDISSTQVTNLGPLTAAPLTMLKANFTGVSDLTPLKGRRLTELELTKTQVSDLSPVEGMPIETLAIAETEITDLAPLSGMPLETLTLDMTRVSDLAPIEGMRLRALGLGFTKVTNLQAIAGMPLKALGILGTEIADLTPLQGMNLGMLAFEPWKIEKGMDVVRAMPNLKIISVGLGHEYTYLNVADFWKRYDQGEFKSGKQKWKSHEELMEWMIKVLKTRQRNR